MVLHPADDDEMNEVEDPNREHKILKVDLVGLEGRKVNIAAKMLNEIEC